MAISNALVPYRGSTTTVSTSSSSSYAYGHSKNSLRVGFFTAQTGHALATELLYRILIDILNRLLSSFHRFATQQFESCASFLERRCVEREEARERAREQAKNGKLRITEEVGRVARERGFGGGWKGGNHGDEVVGGGEVVTCGWTGSKILMGERRPPGWIGGVLEGIQEGRIGEKDFWGGNVFQN